MINSKNKNQIFAAGTVILKGKGINQKVAVIHRPHREDWSFPKGKIDGSESAPAAAVRETFEETGLHVVLHEALTPQNYIFDNLPKTVFYWRARLIQPPKFVPNEEADELVWVSLRSALKLLTYDVDKELAKEAFKARDTKPFILMRHANAEKRIEWANRYSKVVPPDSSRPLTASGVMQTHRIADLLSAFGITKIVSSDSIRCIATVSPYAASQELPLEAYQNLSELGWAVNNQPGLNLVNKLAKENTAIVVCGHRPSLPALAEAISQELNCEDLDATLPPGGALVIHRDLSNKHKPVRSVEKFIVVE
ncbi:NUDIX hydrolase [Actinomycetes bacterium]|nr:NUDIX hydrolase [Actinomycetes bacterium]